MSREAYEVHRRRVQRAVTFVVENLHRPLLVADVAKVAGLSEFHFHRVFAALMGETVGEFVARRRLEVAASMLAYQRDRSISDVADACGFSSSANFAKAFREYFGCRPSDVRKGLPAPRSRIGKLTRRYGKDFDPAELHALPTTAPPEARERRVEELDRIARLEERPALRLACLASGDGYAFDAVMRTWDELIRRGRRLGLCGDAVDAYGIPHDSPALTAPAMCRYFAGIPVPKDVAVPDPLFATEVAAGRFAVFRYVGRTDGLERFYRDVYSLWFPAAGLVPDDRFLPLDHYVNDAPRRGRVDMDVLIKLRSRGARR